MSKWGIEEKETLEAINNIGFKGNILNIAAGDGRFNNILLDLSDSVTAIDINEQELNLLKEESPKELLNRLNIEVVDITKELPFSDSSFDCIFCTGTLHLFNEETISNIINEIKRVLKLNGKIVLDFATDIKRYDKNNNQVLFDGEGSYILDEAISLFNNILKDFDITIKESTFTEDNLDDDTGYNRITGNFIVISGTLIRK